MDLGGDSWEKDSIYESRVEKILPHQYTKPESLLLV